MEQYIRTYDSFSPYYSEQYVPTARMKVTNSVYLPSSDIDFRTGRLQPDRQRRCRTQAMRLEKERLDKEEQRLLTTVTREAGKGGVRVSMRMMVMTVAFTLFFCGVYLLTQQGIIADRQKAINRVERSIKDYRAQNTTLEAQIADASDSAKIKYAAARDLNMIPSEAAEAIHLVAMDTRPMSATARAADGQQAVQTAAASQSASVNAQTTSVPALASAGN